MLALLEMVADFSRGCADCTIGHMILTTRPHRFENRLLLRPATARRTGPTTAAYNVMLYRPHCQQLRPAVTTHVRLYLCNRVWRLREVG